MTLQAMKSRHHSNVCAMLNVRDPTKSCSPAERGQSCICTYVGAAPRQTTLLFRSSQRLRDRQKMLLYTHKRHTSKLKTIKIDN